jgi:hypothetical protein
MKFLKQIAVDLMWLMLIIFPIYPFIIQIIFKPMSYARFFFINAIILPVLILFGYITNILFIPVALLVNLSGRLGTDVFQTNLVSVIISLVIAIFLYFKFNVKEYRTEF